MIEFLLAVGMLMLAYVYIVGERRRLGGELDVLTHITEWMKCQENISQLQQKEIDILTGVLTTEKSTFSAPKEGE